VTLHRLFDCSLGWKHVAAATVRPCVAFDLPGFGASAMPVENRFRSYAQDILSGLDLLGVESFSLVGHSLGGAVAASLVGTGSRTRGEPHVARAGCFGRVWLPELLERSGPGRLARRCMPPALANPLSAAGIYMAVVAHGHPPERQLLTRVMRRAFSAGPGAAAANEAIVAAGSDPAGFAYRAVS